MVELAIAIDPGEVQRAVLGLPPAFLFGDIEDVRRVQHVQRAAAHLANPELVGGGEEVVIGHALGHPDALLAVWVEGAHFHDPALVGVCHEQRLAGSVISVSINQFPHEQYGLPSLGAAFQCHTRKLGRIENALPGLRFRINLGLVRAFAYGELMLVHYAVIAVDVGVGMRDLRDMSQRNTGRARYFVGCGPSARA